MRDVLDYLAERAVEFERHLYVARLLEARVNDTVDDEATRVEVRHVNTLKSGLLIHLYNIVEAATVRTLDVVGKTVITQKPRRWTEKVLKEWVRSTIWSSEEKLGEGAIAKLVSVSGVLAAGDAPPTFPIKGPGGSWDEKAIEKVADRLGCQLVLTDDIKRAASEPVYRDDMTAMKYLASRRNAIAHGATTFEEGARDHTLDEIRSLAGRILPYLEAVTRSYETFLATEVYLTPEAA